MERRQCLENVESKWRRGVFIHSKKCVRGHRSGESGKHLRVVLQREFERVHSRGCIQEDAFRERAFRRVHLESVHE